jgi:hypothetical protein
MTVTVPGAGPGGPRRLVPCRGESQDSGRTPEHHRQLSPCPGGTPGSIAAWQARDRFLSHVPIRLDGGDSDVQRHTPVTVGHGHSDRLSRRARPPGAGLSDRLSAPRRRTSDSVGLRGTESALAELFRVPVLLSAQADPAVPTPDQVREWTPTRPAADRSLVPGLGPTVRKFHSTSSAIIEVEVFHFLKTKPQTRFCF